jgi:hypothetical protein
MQARASARAFFRELNEQMCGRGIAPFTGMSLGNEVNDAFSPSNPDFNMCGRKFTGRFCPGNNRSFRIRGGHGRIRKCRRLDSDRKLEKQRQQRN